MNLIGRSFIGLTGIGLLQDAGQFLLDMQHLVPQFAGSHLHRQIVRLCSRLLTVFALVLLEGIPAEKERSPDAENDRQEKNQEGLGSSGHLIYLSNSAHIPGWMLAMYS